MLAQFRGIIILGATTQKSLIGVIRQCRTRRIFAETTSEDLDHFGAMAPLRRRIWMSH